MEVDSDYSIGAQHLNPRALSVVRAVCRNIAENDLDPWELDSYEDYQDHLLSLDNSDADFFVAEDDLDEDFIVPVPEKIHNEIISLQDSCLNTIVSNFEMIIAAFHTSKDETLQRNILFLRRNYSAKLVQRYNQMEPRELIIHPDRAIIPYLPFLLNEYVEEFRYNPRSRPFTEKVFLERLEEMGHALKKVDFHLCIHIDVPFVHRCIAHLSNANILYIPSFCTNQTLNLISATCPKLEELYCQINPNNCEIFSYGGAKDLCPVENGVLVPNRTLKKLYFSYKYGTTNPIPECVVKFILENYKSLENLNHPALPKVMCDIYKQDLSEGKLNSVKYNITNINLLTLNTKLSSSLYEFLMVCKDVCPNLKKLSTWIDEERELDLIVLFSELKSLRIEQGSSEIDLNSFLKAKGKVLKELILKKFSVSVDVLIQNSPELEFLYLNEVYFQDNVDSIKAHQFPKLRKLHVKDRAHIGIINPMKTVLSACTNVGELVLDGFKLKGYETLLYFTEFCATRNFLESIIIRYCWIRPILLRSILMNCSRLKTITLKGLLNEDPFRIEDIFDLTPHKKRYVKYCNLYMHDKRKKNEEEYEYEFE